MNNQKGFSVPVVIGLLVVLGVIGGAVYFNTRPDSEKMVSMGEDMMHDGEAMMEEGEKMMQEGEGMMQEGESMTEDNAMIDSHSGSYEDYSPEKVAQGDGKKLIFFHANWCPTCHGLDKNINKNIEDIPSDVSILKADFDKENDIKRKYGVTVQHTLVQVDNGGNLIAKWTGSPTLSSVLNQIK